MKNFGCGLGLRSIYHPALLELQLPVGWIKIRSEDYMDSAGQPSATLEQLRKKFPISLQGRCLSIGSSDPINETYLKSLQALIQRIEPVVIADYLCWTSVDQNYLHELLPLPFRENILDYVAERVDKVQETLQQKIYLGNISSYMQFKDSEMMEWDFMNQLSSRTGCGITLDITSVFVNSINHHFDAFDYIHKINPSIVGCVHLAGCTNMGEWVLNSHTEPIAEKVWDLYQGFLKVKGQVSTIIESDQPLSEIDDLRNDFAKAIKICGETSCGEVSQKSQRPVKGKPYVESTPERCSLTDTQRWVKTHVFKMETNRKLDATPLSISKGMDIQERLRTYEIGYLNQISEMLIQVYPSTCHVLGQHSFKMLAYEYAAGYKSRHYNVQRTGDRFPEFLRNHTTTDRLPFLPDLAELERKIQHCYHANDVEPLGADILSRYAPEDWERLTFEFQPSFDLFESDWPVADIWHERNALEGEHQKSLIGCSQKIMIYRKGYVPECQNVDNEIAWSILKHMYRGKTLGETLEIVGSEGESVLTDLSSYFQVWTEGGIFCGVDTV